MKQEQTNTLRQDALIWWYGLSNSKMAALSNEYFGAKNPKNLWPDEIEQIYLKEHFAIMNDANVNNGAAEAFICVNCKKIYASRPKKCTCGGQTFEPTHLSNLKETFRNNDAIPQEVIDAIEAMVYYSQIHTVKGVRPAGMISHETAWRTAQKWLWEQCKRDDDLDKYVLKETSSTNEGLEDKRTRGNWRISKDGNYIETDGDTVLGICTMYAYENSDNDAKAICESVNNYPKLKLENEQLKQERGLLKIHSENNTTLLASCETALKSAHLDNEKLSSLIESLTPGGSEFVNDPEYCIQFAKDQMQAAPKAILIYKLEAEQLRGLNKELVKALECWQRWAKETPHIKGEYLPRIFDRADSLIQKSR